MNSSEYTVKVTGKKSGKAVSKTLSLSVKTVNNGAKILDGDISLTVGATQKLNVKKIPTAATIASFVSDKEEVAKVAADGTVEAVAVGEANIYFTTDYGAKSAAIKVTVTEKEAEVPQLTAVKQTASNGFEATFSTDASKIDKADLKVVANDDSKLELLVNEIKASEDGKILAVTLYNDFTNGTSYTVSYKESSQTLNAKVGDVARINILTASAQQNVPQKIEFVLIDDNGYDITHSINLDTKVQVEVVDGNYSSIDFAKASAAKITMGTVGEKVTIRVTYNSNAANAEDVKQEAEITCVDPKAVVGKAMYVSEGWAPNINERSQCFKFYTGRSDSEVKVAVDDTNPNIYFCAVDENGDAIFYDKYEAVSNADNTVSVNVRKDNGKYATMTISGNAKGKAVITVNATVNGKTTPYYMNVVVTAEAKPSRLTLEQTYTSMSNAIDELYNGEVRAYVYDTDGNKIKPDSVEFKVYDWDNKHAQTISTTAAALGFGMDNYDSPAEISTSYWWDGTNSRYCAKYYAAAAKAGTYTIEVTASKDDWTQTKRVSVSVDELPKEAYLESGVAVTYQLELGKSEINEADYTWGGDTTSVRVKALVNGKFAGYVRSKASAAFDGWTKSPAASTVCVIGMGSLKEDAYEAHQVIPKAKDMISDITVNVKYGNMIFKKTGETVNVFNAKTNSNGANGARYLVDEITVDTVSTSYGTSKIYADCKDDDFAKTGSYTVQAFLDYETGTDSTMSKTLTVKNTMYVPTVDISSKSVSSTSLDTMKKVMTASVDMNNDEGASVSITGFATTNGVDITTDTNGKFIIKYVKVVENDVTFYVPKSATFVIE